jgi:hypothetical protein
MREFKIVPRDRTSTGGTGGAVSNSWHADQLEIVDLI